MTSMLSVDDKDRKGPESILFFETIRNLWPEVLCEPVNPHIFPEQASLRRRIKNTLGISD